MLVVLFVLSFTRIVGWLVVGCWSVVFLYLLFCFCGYFLIPIDICLQSLMVPCMLVVVFVAVVVVAEFMVIVLVFLFFLLKTQS